MDELRFAKSASKHHVSEERATYVIDHCGMVLPQPPPANNPDDHDERLVFLGDDRSGIPLEVVAIEVAAGKLVVIHAQKLRDKSRAAYRRVIGYQR
ncbi:MAG: hypothetical protein ACR2MY_07135 [Candidatus Dormibacteria bacterium]